MKIGLYFYIRTAAPCVCGVAQFNMDHLYYISSEGKHVLIVLPAVALIDKTQYVLFDVVGVQLELTWSLGTNMALCCTQLPFIFHSTCVDLSG